MCRAGCKRLGNIGIKTGVLCSFEIFDVIRHIFSPKKLVLDIFVLCSVKFGMIKTFRKSLCDVFAENMKL